MKESKYKTEDLIKLINQNKSTEEIGIIYNVSGRTIRNWFKKESLESKVKYKGFDNIKFLDENKKKERLENLIKFNKLKLKDRVKCICKTCEKEYSVKESVFKIGTKFCSRKCLYIHLFKTNPENHPRWLGGKTQENKIGRSSVEYVEWRINVWKRDRFTCQKCLNIGKNLNAHHIKSWSENIDERYNVDNGVTLCKDCHKELHKEYGQKTNKIQLLEFLNIKTSTGWKRTNLENS
jgi:5-methylcytosine-specific restriction endonuclease McrA